VERVKFLNTKLDNEAFGYLKGAKNLEKSEPKNLKNLKEICKWSG